MTERLLNPEELAARLNVPKSWIYGQTRKRGKDSIPCVRLGKYCRFVETDVMAWLKRTSERRSR